MEYEIINKDQMTVWRGEGTYLAWKLGLLCEQFPDEWFRVKAVLFD